jgi:hypothetical protein
MLPLINLAFDLGAGLAGDDLRGGRRVPVGLHAEYVAGAPATGTIGAGRMEVSYDAGATWQTVRLTGGHATWHGTLTVPRGVASVSLRVSASDDRGGSVRQEIVRATGVKAATDVLVIHSHL